VQNSQVTKMTDSLATGHLELERANVNWKLSIDANDLPAAVVAQGKRTYRSIVIGQDELEFSEGFTDLHTDSYRAILAGQGYGIADTRPSIELAHVIRNSKPS
jgi:UDP-N-acetyl-2-amino-2-deoxyglucuronate dehydrogenase